MSMVAGPRVLIVDDDAERARGMAAALAAAGYAVGVRGDSVDGLVAIEEEQPALVLLNWTLSSFIDSATFLRALEVGLPAPPPVIALLDAKTDPIAAERVGARACVRFSTDVREVVQLVEIVLSSSASMA